MLRKRNDAERNTADREMALTRITSAWVIVLSVLLWATTSSPGNRSIRFSIQGSFGGDIVCVGSEGECAEDTEMMRTAMRQEFDVRTGRAWRLVMHGPDDTDYPNKGASTGAVSCERIGFELTSSKRGIPAMQVEMMGTSVKEGKAQLTMRMVFVSSQTAGDEKETEDAWRAAA